MDHHLYDPPEGSAFGTVRLASTGVAANALRVPDGAVYIKSRITGHWTLAMADSTRESFIPFPPKP